MAVVCSVRSIYPALWIQELRKHHRFSVLQPQKPRSGKPHTVFLSREIFIQYISESRMFPKGTSTQNDKLWDHSANTPSLLKITIQWRKLTLQNDVISSKGRRIVITIFFFFTKRVTSLTSSKLMGRMVEDNCSLHLRIHNKFPLNIFLTWHIQSFHLLNSNLQVAHSGTFHFRN